MLISNMLDEREESLRAFSDPLRTQIVRLLAVEQLCTCHLVELTGARQPTISYHLKTLRAAGLVDAEPAGRFTYYRLCPEALDAACDFLGELADSARTATAVRRPCS